MYSVFFSLALVLPALVFPAFSCASDLRLIDDFYLNDDAKHVGSLPGAFDCSELYDVKLAYCFDELKVFDVDEELLAVIMAKQKARSVEYSTPLTAASYTTVLAGLRRQGLVFAHLNVNDETLDVLAGIHHLDRRTLDEQMFVLANRYDFTVSREYLFLDKGAFNRAYRQGIQSITQWLSTTDKAVELRKHDRVVTMTVSAEQITITVAYPFAAIEL